MRIIQLTPGTGNFYCGACLRDNALVRALRAKGHDVLMVPLYLPVAIDEPAESAGAPIFLSGISVFLEQKLPVFRHMPGWLNRLFSSPALLRLSANLSGLTTAKELGESAVSMLQGRESRHAVEVARLMEWLRTQPPPDVICLSNSLLSGLTGRLKEQFHAPVVSSLQGEDSFLDGLPEPYRRQSWELLAKACADIDQFVAPSQYHADLMRQRLGLAAGKVAVVPNGIPLDGFAPAASPPSPPVLGYLARMNPAKGLGTLIDAFIQLKKSDRVKGLKLRVAGAKTPSDASYVRKLQRRLAAQKLSADAEFLPNLDRPQKQAFLRSLSVFSVPAAYGESFGLYLLEALASGVPVVQPRHGAFPELVAQTGGGLLYEADNPATLAETLQQLLLDPVRSRRLGEAGRKSVQEKFSAEAMADRFETVLASLAERSH